MSYWLKEKLNTCFSASKKMLVKSLIAFGLFFSLALPTSPLSITYANAAPNTSTETINAAQKQTEQLISWNNTLQVLSSLVYVIIWPLVALAGLAMDNQLIY